MTATSTSSPRKGTGLPAHLAAWTDALGWEAVLNRKGTTWRKLAETQTLSVGELATRRMSRRVGRACDERVLVVREGVGVRGHEPGLPD